MVTTTFFVMTAGLSAGPSAPGSSMMHPARLAMANTHAIRIATRTTCLTVGLVHSEPIFSLSGEFCTLGVDERLNRWMACSPTRGPGRRFQDRLPRAFHVLARWPGLAQGSGFD